MRVALHNGPPHPRMNRVPTSKSVTPMKHHPVLLHARWYLEGCRCKICLHLLNETHPICLAACTGVAFSGRFNAKAKHLVSGLLVSNPQQRLGSGKQGNLTIIQHGFLRGNLIGQYQQRLINAPWVPKEKDWNEMTSNTEVEAMYDSESIGSAQLEQVTQKVVEAFSTL